MDILLPTPTNGTESGPKLTMEGSRLAVDYDYEGENGLITSGRVVFEGVLSFVYWDSSCCPVENILAATRVRVLEKSGYLSDITESWNDRVGFHEWEQKQGGAGRFRHFTICFDDSCAIDVVAQKCQVDR